MKRNLNQKYILALDQGTTGSRAFIFDQRGRVLAQAYKEFKQYFPKPGWVEHDAREIWASCVKVVKEALKKGRINPRTIAAIGITNQRETTVLWHRKTSRPVAHAIVWQCRRTADICQGLRRHTSKFRNKTGLVLDPYFSGTKIKWYLDNIRGLRQKAKHGEICFGTIDSWLIWNLTGGKSHVTDLTNASRTLIFNIRSKDWDRELLNILGIPKEILPKVQPSGSVFGAVQAKRDLPQLSGIPIASVLGDQQAALYGQGCYKAGSVKNTYGTGCFLVLNTGQRLIHSKMGLLSTIASDERGHPVYALEGSIFIAGAVVQWLRDQLKVIEHSAQTERIIASLKDTNGVYFVPAFAGLGAPFWDSEARGIITGLTRGANIKHITRAALEAIAYQTKDVFDVMKKELGRNIKELKVDGGACQNNFLMQFQADVLGCRLVRPVMVDSTVLGAAQLAGVVAGLWNKANLKSMSKKDRVFKPEIKASQRISLYQNWQKAVRQARA